MLTSPLLMASGSQLARSVRLRSSASAYFNRTPASAGNRKTWTWSGWVKRGALGTSQVLFIGYVDVNNKTRIDISSADILRVYDITGGATERVRVYTSQVFRDPSAWYHIVVSLDTTQATASDRVKVYVNGSQVTAFGTASYPSQNTDLYINATNAHALGGSPPDSQYFDGYLTDINFIDGQALTPSSFGETNSTTGVWQPKTYTGTYGTNGFELTFVNPAAATAAVLGKDYSGNGNNWTPNNISVTAGSTYDSMLDVPSLIIDGGSGRGNYCVMNPLINPGGGGAYTAGNLNISTSNTTNYDRCLASFYVTNGKWYWEYTLSSASAMMVGIAGSVRTPTAAGTLGFYSDEYAYYSTGQKYNNATLASFGASYTNGDVIGVAFDIDNGTLAFYKNGVSQGTAFTGLSGGFFPAIGNAAGSSTGFINFGQRPFTYTPPSGFSALNTLNLTAPTVTKGIDWMNIALATGANIKASADALFTGNELVWIKDRANVNNNQLMDSLRGASTALYSNASSAETAYTAPTGNSVGWAWKEGATGGFDIVTYTGTGVARTVAHTLGVKPSLMLVKNRTDAITNWLVYHSVIGATNFLLLNTTAASAASANPWNNTEPTSTVFTVGVSNASNENGFGIVAYLWAEVAGYSRFSSYTGNGSTDGTFVFCGFRPRYIFIKASSTTGDWVIYDTSRDTYNAAGLTLYTNLTNAEADGRPALDIVSNGFKLRGTGSNYNTNGATYVFAAFAENPFKYALAR